jgi:hypothetical protein
MALRGYLRDGHSVIFVFRYLNDAAFGRIVLIVLLPSGLLMLACAIRGALDKV